MVAEIAKLLGAANPSVTLANEMTVPVKVENGRVYHENLALTVNGFVVPARPALAGKRHTVWAYPPGAGPRGAVEAETWVTTTRASRASGTDAEYRVEIENGLSDGLSLDVYLVSEGGGADESEDPVASLRTIIPVPASELELDK